MTMIEKIARALEPHAWPGSRGQIMLTEEGFESMRRRAREHARTALMVMREPTFEMKEAATGEISAYYDSYEELLDTTRDVWQAMIDKALSDA